MSKHGVTMAAYQDAALRTWNPNGGDDRSDLAYLALGLIGEAGEVAEQIKKHFRHGHALDVTHLAEELGDVLWYVAALPGRFLGEAQPGACGYFGNARRVMKVSSVKWTAQGGGMMVTIDVWSVLQTVGLWLLALLVTMGVAYAGSKSQRWGVLFAGVLLALATVGVAMLLQVALVRLL